MSVMKDQPQGDAPKVASIRRANLTKSEPARGEQGLDSALGRLVDRVNCKSPKEMFMALVFVRAITLSRTDDGGS